MGLSMEIIYGNLVKGLQLGNAGWLRRANTLVEVPEAAENGAVSFTYISGVTAAAISDGSMITNNIDTTTKAGVLIDYQASISLKPSQVKSFYTKPENVKMIAQAAADALDQEAQNALIVDLIASTPMTGADATLTLGQIDFSTDGTVAEAYDNLKNMAKVVSKMFAQNQGTPLKDMAIVMAPAAYGNFIVLNATGTIGNVSPVVQNLNPDLWDGALHSFMGVPIFAVDGATDFTGADKHCAFVTTRNGVLLARKAPYIHGGGMIAASDGTTKLITIGPIAHGVVTGFFGEIINPSS